MERLTSYEADRLNDALYGMDTGGEAQSSVTARFVRTDPDGTTWVRFEGAGKDTPLTSAMSVMARQGDLIDVRLGGYEATGGGNRTDPSAGYQDVKAVNIEVEHVKGKQAEFEKLTAQEIEAEKARIGHLEADSAEIGELVAQKASIADLQAAEGRILSLESDNVTVKGRLDAAEADIDDLEAEDARIGNLVAGKADITDLTAATGRITVLESTKANISDLEANYITADDIEATYMHANMSNSDVAWISNGVIANGAISSAMINDVSANKLTAGTINGSVINVTNLNADNITTGTINGQRIGEGSLSLDKLSEDVYTEAEVDAKLSSMQAEIDGAIETWTGTEVPTLNNAPASAWTTTADRDKHVGDVYFNTTSGYNYRFTKSGSTYEWVQIKDTDITNALQRIQTAEGKITTFDSDISTLKTDTGELKTKTQSLETSLGDKVNTTAFNELSSTVDENSATITTHSTVLSNNGLTTTTDISNTVNSVSQTATSNSSKISQLTTTLGTNADGTTKTGDIVSRMSAAEQDLSGFKTTVSETYATQVDLSGVQTTAENANGKAVAYSATSSTGSTTAAKVAACKNFPTLAAGVTVTVRFSSASTSTGALTLNVNSTGAKTIYVNGSATSSTNQLLWGANANITFTYDGTYWRVDSEPRSWYGTCSIAAGTAAKSAVISEAVICKGTNVTLNMSSENTNTSATLNITSTGAKNIYYGTTTTRPTTDNGYGWTAASTVTFVFDGAYWRLGDTSALAGLVSVKGTVTEHTTSIQQNADAIKLKANASDVDTLTGRVSTAESTITQQARQIEAKVSKDGVIAAINLSSESATISADKVNITGTAIFSALGSSNKVVTATQTQWYSSTSTTTKSGGSWATTQPSVVAGRYIWQREYITYSDGSHEYKPSEAGVCVQGQTDLSAYSTTAQANELYDSAGSASAAQAAAISAAASDATSKANAAEANAKAAIPTDISDLNNDAGYQTSSDVSAAISTGTANLAAKADAVARTQRIYYRQTASGSAPGVNNTWLSTSGTGYGNWSLSIPQLTSGDTKYPKLYMATQTQTVAQKAAGMTCSCTTPALDDSTTIIDGGNIITHSVTAEQLNATSINASNSLTIGAMATETQESILNSNVDVPTSLGQLENDVGYTTGEQVSRNFYQEDEPEPPYSVGDTWMTGSGTVKVCAISKDEGDSYDASDWVDADDTANSLANLSASIGQVEINLNAAVSSTEENLSKDISAAAASAKTALEGAEARINSELADAQEWRNYLRFTTEDGLTIGQSDSSLYRQVMDAHGTHWQYDGEDAASVQVDAEGNGVMVLDRSEVADRMRIGDYVWINRGGRINLRYDPVEE